jgi:hypothetical protein
MGCEEKAPSCVETYYDCQEAIPQLGTVPGPYCGLIRFLAGNGMELSDEEIIRECNIFRAGHMCQCLSGCFADLEESYFDIPVEEYEEIQGAISDLYCPWHYAVDE